MGSASGAASPVVTRRRARVRALGPGLTFESADAARAVLRDDLSAGPQIPGTHLAYEKSLYLDALSPEVISIITAQMPRKQSPMSLLLAFPMGGAFCQVPDGATAFGGSRAPGVIVNAAAIAPEPGLLAADRDWARQVWQDLLPHAPGAGSYVNFMNDYEADRVRASYGPAKYQRLAQVKATYDPGNVFHRNPNINPAG